MHAANHVISMILVLCQQSQATVKTPPSLEVTEAKIESFDASLQEIESLLSLLQQYANNVQRPELDAAEKYDELVRQLKTQAFIVVKLRQVVERSLEDRYALEVLLQQYQAWANFLKTDAEANLKDLQDEQNEVKKSRKVGEDTLKVLWLLLAEAIGNEASSKEVSGKQIEALRRKEKRARDLAKGYETSPYWEVYRDKYAGLTRPQLEEEIQKVHQQTELHAFNEAFFACAVEEHFKDQLETLDRAQRDAVRRAEAAIKETRSLESNADRLSAMARYLDTLLERTDAGNIHQIRSRTQQLMKIGADKQIRAQIEKLGGPRTKAIDVDPLQALEDPVEQIEDPSGSSEPPADEAATP
jgi:hypothetical protein